MFYTKKHIRHYKPSLAFKWAETLFFQFLKTSLSKFLKFFLFGYYIFFAIFLTVDFHDNHK